LSDLETFRREIEETDAFIAALAPEGAALVRAIKATGSGLELREEGAAYNFYFNGLTNSFHGAAGLPLAVRFNLRVHEGAHALHFAEAKDMTQALNNLASGSASGPLLSPQASMIARELGETAAHALQAKFNALAVRETGLREFVTCLEGNLIESFVQLQLDLIDQGLDPEDVRTEVAKQYLSLETPSQFSIFFTRNVTWKEELDSFSLAGYLQALDAHGGTIARDRLVDLPEIDRMRLLDVFEPLACSLEILENYRKPLEISEFNQDLLNEITPNFV